MAEVLPDEGGLIRQGNTFYCTWSAPDLFHSGSWESPWFDMVGYQMWLGIARVQNPNGTGTNLLEFHQRTVTAEQAASGLGAADGYMTSGRAFNQGGYVTASQFGLPIDGYLMPSWSANQNTATWEHLALQNEARFAWIGNADTNYGLVLLHLRFLPTPMLQGRN